MLTDAADAQLLIENLQYLEESISEAFGNQLFAITIITEENSTYLRVDFGADYVYIFSLLNKMVDWRFLDARNARQQYMIIDLVDTWAHDVFSDGRRRRACQRFVAIIGEELVARVFSPERVNCLDWIAPDILFLF